MSYNKYVPYLRDLLFVLVIYTLYRVSALISVELQRILCDASVCDSTFGSTI